MLTLLFIGVLIVTLAFVFLIGPGTIVVPEDYPTIQEAIKAATPGETIFVKEGIYYENLIIDKSVRLIGERANRTIIDGQRKGVVIKVTTNDVFIGNLTIRNSGLAAAIDAGIKLDSVENCIISNNILLNNSNGILLSSSFNNTIIKNKVVASKNAGICFQKSDRNDVLENNLTENEVGISLSFSKENILRRNIMVRNKYNFGVWGETLSDFVNDVDISNTVNNKPIYYFINKRGLVINHQTFPSIGYLALINCSNMMVQGLSLTDNIQGVLLAFAQNITLKDLSLKNNFHGVSLIHSSNNIISGGEIRGNAHGVWLDSSSNNTISWNNVESNSENGVTLSDSYWNIILCNNIVANGGTYGGFGADIASSFNIIFKNKILNNFCGIKVGSNNTILENVISGSSRSGINLGGHGNVVSKNNVTNNLEGIHVESECNVISRNYIADNLVGIYLYFTSSNIIIENNITANRAGILFEYAYNNVIYHNNFIGNVPEQVNTSPAQSNTWDNGYPSGGNYWSDYTGVDEYSGPYQNETGSDGIGDTPYVIDENNTDRYPLMAPFS
jgi:parallel beta-helix repeat protein